MIVGYHLIWTAYGSWLPNDPRGSSSHEIRCAEIVGLGELHHGRKKVQPAAGDIRAFYEAARQLLKHELLKFSSDEIQVIAKEFANVIRQQTYTCYSCAIMPDHVHMLIRKHRDNAEKMIEHFQDASREALIASAHRPADHPVWGGPGWKVYLETRGDFERVIRYINDNPIKAGRHRQIWDFVTPYDGWLPGLAPR
jgi:REP element-mobilizing transposase RayT